MTITAAITAFCNMVKAGLGLKETSIKEQTTTEVVKDKKSLKKGTNYAEQLLEITDCYMNQFTEAHLKKYQKLKRKFNKNN